MKEIQTGDNSYPKYRRRSPSDGGLTALIRIKNRDYKVDIRWIASYNPLLSRIFNAHINVEYCNSVKSIKCICKYINSGSDQATYSLNNENNKIEIF